jgi:hypothetical protein
VVTRFLFMSLLGAAVAILVVTVIIIKRVGTPDLDLGLALLLLGIGGIGLAGVDDTSPARYQEPRSAREILSNEPVHWDRGV